jgi:hypothetical protein
MGTINTPTQYGMLRIRLNLRTRVPAEVRAFWSTVESTVFKVAVEVIDDVGLFFKNI